MAALAPNALDMEAAMLGAVLHDARYLVDVRAVVQPGECFLLRHEETYAAMLRLADRGEVVDALTVGDELAVAGLFETYGGDAWLAQLAGACPVPSRAADYARKVAARAYDRSLLAAADRLRALAHDGAMDARQKRAEAEALVAGGPDGATDSTITAYALMNDYLESIEATRTLPAGVAGLATGFTALDDLLDGLQPESLNYVAARPGMGKTSLLLGVALHVARQGGRVYFWSGEMGKRQLSERLMAMQTELTAGALRRGLRPGGLSDAQWGQTLRGAGALSQLKLVLDDGEDMTPALLRAHAEMVARRLGGLDLICVDYIGLLEPGVKKENREKELAFISRKLKRSLAKLAPVLCAAQLNRGVEGREDKRPTLRDLRDSGSQEQDGDTVLFLYRDVVYHPTTEFPNAAEVIVAKNRHGATGAITLHFEKRLTRFSNATLMTVDLRAV